MAGDCLHKSEQQIRSQVSKLTQILTMTTTDNFPPPDRHENQNGGRQTRESLGRGPGPGENGESQPATVHQVQGETTPSQVET